MSSFDLNQDSIEEDEHDLRVPNHLSTTLYHHSSDYNCITFSDQHQQREHKEILFVAGTSCDDHSLIAPDPANNSHGSDDLDLSLCDPFSSFKREKEEEEEELGIRERNWMPSKMRLIRKMMKYSTHMIVSKPRSGQDEIQPDRGFPLKNIARKNNSDNSTSSSDIIRVCSDCNTTKTPLWRSGPCGPKSLCNACGIRKRKARRAMATALNGVGILNNGGGHATLTMRNKIRKEKKLGIDRTDLPFKKRCKMNIGTAPPPLPPPKKIRFEDATMLASDDHNSSSTVLEKVFPREETDAAILLMALSCGVIRS